MDDNRTTRPIITERGTPIRTRILLLVLAGVLLLCGVYIWVTAVRQKEEPTPILVGSEVPAPGPAQQPAALAGGPKPLVAAWPNLSKGIAAQPGAQPTTTLSTVPPLRPSGLPPAANPANQATGVPGVSTKMPAATPVNPLQPATPLPNTAAQPPAAGAVPAGTTPPATTAAQPGVPAVPAVAGQPSVVTAADVQPLPAQPDPGSFFVPKSIASTTRLAAAVDARAALGRTDPCAMLENYKPFPRVGGKVHSKAETSKTEIAAASKEKKVTPPPPPPQFGLVPPPPPGEMSEGMSVAELPAPPTKPSLSGKMKLVAIVGDRAILAFSDRSIARENKWPSTVTLGPGEQFESVSMVDVNPDSVTLEEDGERSTKAMAPLR